MSFSQINRRIEKRRQVIRRRRASRRVGKTRIQTLNQRAIIPHSQPVVSKDTVLTQVQTQFSDKEWAIYPDNPLYFVSKDGCIYSTVTNKLINQQRVSDKDHSYQRVTLTSNELSSTVKVHHVVARTFLGQRPSGVYGEVIRHLDGNAFNNHLSNLAYGSHKQNAEDSLQHGTRHSKLSTADVMNVKLLLACKHTLQSVANAFSVSRATIAAIHSGRTWQHLIGVPISNPYRVPRLSSIKKDAWQLPLFTAEQINTIKSVRKHSGLTDKQIAGLYGLLVNTVSNINTALTAEKMQIVINNRHLTNEEVESLASDT
jgi:hypothetical protein